MTNSLIRPAGTEPGPGDMDADGYIWIFVATCETWTSGNHWWHVSADRHIFWQRHPWLPGWAIPIPVPSPTAAELEGKS